MKALATTPPLAEQVRDAILAEIASGRLVPGERIIQERVTHALGVSRQPVQQALNLLRNQGVLQEAHGRGLIPRLSRVIRSAPKRWYECTLHRRRRLWWRVCERVRVGK